MQDLSSQIEHANKTSDKGVIILMWSKAKEDFSEVTMGPHYCKTIFLFAVRAVFHNVTTLIMVSLGPKLPNALQAIYSEHHYFMVLQVKKKGFLEDWG